MTSFAVVKRFPLDQPSAVERRLAGMTTNFEVPEFLDVMPAQAGIHSTETWMTSLAVVKRFPLDQPSAVERRFAGMTVYLKVPKSPDVMPAQAGIH